MENDQEGRRPYKWREVINGCSMCDWHNKAFVPADVIPGSQIDIVLMDNIKDQFHVHNLRSHMGEAELKLISSNL